METSPEQIAADAATIKKLGGPSKVATLLGWQNPTGHRRVANWIKRGIPAAVKLQYPLIFLAGMQMAAPAYTRPPAPPRPTPLPPFPAPAAPSPEPATTK